MPFSIASNRRRSWAVRIFILRFVSFHKSIRSFVPRQFICVRMSWLVWMRSSDVPTAALLPLPLLQQYGICQWMSHIFRAFLPQFIYFHLCAVWRFVCSFVLWLETHIHISFDGRFVITTAVHQYCRRAFDSIYNRMFMQSNIKCLCVSFFFSMFSFAVVVCRVTTYFFHSPFFLFWISCFVSRVSAIVE